MRVLCLGDIVGRAGRSAVMQAARSIKQSYSVDLLVVNGENSTGGFGLNAQQAKDLLKAGVDVLTLGDHAWDQKDIIPLLAQEPRIVRALNFPEGTPGQGATMLNLPGDRSVMIIQLMGRVFMDPQDDPFRAVDKLLERFKLGSSVTSIIVDVHAEASSEKVALGYYLDGRVSCVFGTHTHIPTADTRILPKGTAFQSDLGMCGDYDSVIGFEPDKSIARFLKKVPREKFTPAVKEATLSGILVDIDDATGLAKSIEPFRQGGVLSNTPPAE